MRFKENELFCLFHKKFQTLKKCETKTFSIIYEFSHIFYDIKKKKKPCPEGVLQIKILTGFGNA